MEYKSMYCNQCEHCKKEGYVAYRRDSICNMCENGSMQEVGDPLKRRDDAMTAANAYIVAGRANGKTDYYTKLINSVYGSCAFRSQCVIPSIKQVIFNPPATIVIWSDDIKTVVKAHNEQFDPEKGLAMAITKRVLGNKGNFNNVINKHVNAYYKRLQKEAEKEYCKRDLEITEAIAKTVTFDETTSENAVKALIDEAEKECRKGLVEGLSNIDKNVEGAAKAFADATKAAVDYADSMKIANDLLIDSIADKFAEIGSVNTVSPEELKAALANAPYHIWYRVYENGKIVSSGMSLKSYKRKGNAINAAKKMYGDKPHITWVVSRTNPWGDEKTDNE